MEHAARDIPAVLQDIEQLLLGTSTFLGDTFSHEKERLALCDSFRQVTFTQSQIKAMDRRCRAVFSNSNQSVNDALMDVFSAPATNFATWCGTDAWRHHGPDDKGPALLATLNSVDTIGHALRQNTQSLAVILDVPLYLGEHENGIDLDLKDVKAGKVCAESYTQAIYGMNDVILPELESLAAELATRCGYSRESWASESAHNLGYRQGQNFTAEGQTSQYCKTFNPQITAEFWEP